MSSEVNLSNWRLSPHSRWAFQNIRQLIPTAAIGANRSPQSLTEYHSALLDTIGFDAVEGKRLVEFLQNSFSDSMVILHRGQKIWQWHATYCDVNRPHIIFSVSKSVTAMLAGVLAGQGLLDPAKLVAHYLSGTKDSAYADCSLQQLLDMQVALEFEESYLSASGDYRRYRDATGWNPLDQNNPGPDLETFLYGLKKSASEHGSVFEYKSPNSDLLGLVIERAAGMSYADCLSSLIWQPMGAESDGYVTVDRKFLARGAGGVCVTVNDLARFGQLLLDKGEANGQQLIPECWIEDTSSAGSRSAWQKGDFANLFPDGGYRNQWYQAGDGDGTIVAIGIHGQWLYINPSTEVVIAKLASQPRPVDDRLDALNLAIFAAISAALKHS